MKFPPIIILLMIALLGRSLAEEVYYLHCFTPTTGQKIDPLPSEEPATPPARVITLRITPGSDFEALFGDRHDFVSGHLTSSNESLDLQLEGSVVNGFAFDGKVRLEEVFEPRVTSFSGIVCRYKCVVSRQKEIKPFLKAQAAIDAKRLQEDTQTTHENQRKAREAEQPKAD